MSKPGSRVWFAAAMAVSVALRAWLVALPAPGRDEAAYAFWSRHLEPAYAVLLQLSVRLFGTLPLPPILALRLTSLLSGLAVLFLLNRVLAQGGLEAGARRAVVAAVALMPWQIYVGAVLHPDALFLGVLLAAAWAAGGQRWALAGLCLGLSVLAKPTGLCALATGTVFLALLPGVPPARRARAVALGWMAASPALVTLGGPILQAMGNLGRVSAGHSAAAAIPVLILAFGGLAGLFVPAAAAQGLWRHRGQWRSLLKPGPGSLPLWLGLGLTLAFLAAALMRGQFKANWILPGFVLLLPAATLHRHRRLLVGNALVSMALALGMALTLHTGEPLATLERSIPWLAQTYRLQAGSRESRVSATATWSDRVREYRPLDGWMNRVREFWPEAPPRWILSDDYGLAAQTTWAWNGAASQLVLPDDGMYRRSTVKGLQSMRGPVLVLAVHSDPIGWNVALPPPERTGTVTHPVTNTPVTLLFVRFP